MDEGARLLGRPVNVSVLVCSHGDPKWERLGLERAVPSAEAQGLKPYEIIYRHEPDATIAQVRNRAAEDAPGEWLCFLDADDELAPGYVAAMRKVMRLWNLSRRGDLIDNPVLLIPSVQYVRAAARTGFEAHESEPAIPDWGRPLIDVNCAVIGTLVPRSLFLEAGGFMEWPIYEDWDLWLRCRYRHGADLVPVPDAVYRAHVGAGGRNQGANAAATYRRIRERYLQLAVADRLP